MYQIRFRYKQRLCLLQWLCIFCLADNAIHNFRTRNDVLSMKTFCITVYTCCTRWKCCRVAKWAQSKKVKIKSRAYIDCRLQRKSNAEIQRNEKRTHARIHASKPHKTSIENDLLKSSVGKSILVVFQCECILKWSTSTYTRTVTHTRSSRTMQPFKWVCSVL